MQGVNGEKEHAVWNWVKILGAARGGPKSPRASAELIFDEAQDMGRGMRGPNSPRTPAELILDKAPGVSGEKEHTVWNSDKDVGRGLRGSSNPPHVRGADP